MSTKPVVVYGASGYTGRLVCEYLRELNVPFTAAGRDKDRIQAVMEKIPGIETADYDIAEVEHDVASLTDLFQGSQVVSNMAGPFIKFGGDAVEAALAAGCHYLHHRRAGLADGVEVAVGQGFRRQGSAARAEHRADVPTGEIAANICLETPGLDTLDILVLWKGFRRTRRCRRFSPSSRPITSISNRTSTSSGRRPAPSRWPCRASTRSPLPCPGAVLTSGVVQGRSAGGRRRRVRAGEHAASREPPAEHLSRLGVRIRPAWPCALRHPWELQLQAVRSAPGVFGVLPAAAVAEAGRLRVRLTGLRAPGIVGNPAQLRAGAGAGADGSELTDRSFVRQLVPWW